MRAMPFQQTCGQACSEPSMFVSMRPAQHPLLFQDVDGVLNRYIQGTPELDPKLLQNLRRTVDNTDADLVLSTQWRKYPQHSRRLREALQESGIPSDRIVGQTPSLCGGPGCRVQEIKAFLDSHAELLDDGKHWAAVDDEDLSAQDPEFMQGHFVQTNPLQGLTEKRAKELENALVADKGDATFWPVLAKVANKAGILRAL
mmetsp:Transcript_28257/g.45472  ORF Transcript_28257/g.45472 Transcript_28257/m.45472 type:complete len:201 (+) Transcript_28257:27-629(+)